MFAPRILGLAVACLAAAPAFALDQGEYRLNGFGTLGMTYLGGEDDGRSYGINGQTTDSWRFDELSKLGGQLGYGVTDDISLTAQVIAKAQHDSWDVDLEWFYLSFQATDRLVLRAGRLRNPVYMYSEALDVGFTYPWIRLPDEVYHQVQISSYEGVDFIYSMPLSFGTFSVQANGGQALNRDYFFYDTTEDMDYRKIAGASVALESSNYGTLRFSYSEADLTLDGALRATLDDTKGKFTSLGYQYDNGTWITANEATRLVVEGVVPTKNAFYMMGGRRFGDFLPHLTYAQLDEQSGGRQVSWTYGLNYSLLPNVTLKGEYKRVDTSNEAPGVFVKTGTEYFTDLAMNQLFGIPQPTYDGDIFSVGIDFVF